MADQPLQSAPRGVRTTGQAPQRGRGKHMKAPRTSLASLSLILPLARSLSLSALSLSWPRTGTAGSRHHRRPKFEHITAPRLDSSRPQLRHCLLLISNLATSSSSQGKGRLGQGAAAAAMEAMAAELQLDVATHVHCSSSLPTYRLSFSLGLRSCARSSPTNTGDFLAGTPSAAAVLWARTPCTRGCASLQPRRRSRATKPKP